MPDAILYNHSNIKNEYQLLADITLSSAATLVDLTGLSIGKGDEVLLVCDFNNTTATGSDYLILVNGNETWANYYRQYIIVGSTTINASRLNNSGFSLANEYRKSLAKVNIKLTNAGYFTFQAHTTQRYDESSNYQLYDVYGTSTFTMTSITSVRVSATVTNAIGIGSRFQLYKIGGA